MNTFTLRIDGGPPHPVLHLDPIGVGVNLELVATTGGSGGREALPGPAQARPIQARLGATALDELWSWWTDVRDHGQADLRSVELRGEVAELGQTVLLSLEDVLLCELSFDFCPPVEPHRPDGPRAMGRLNLLVTLQPRSVDLSRGE